MAAILLLGVIVLILHKAGFFARNRPEGEGKRKRKGMHSISTMKTKNNWFCMCKKPSKITEQNYTQSEIEVSAQ